MRRTQLAVIAVLAVGMVACSEQPPEVSINEQVPAAQQVAEPAEGEEGEGGEAPAAADFASADVVWVADGLAFTDAPDTMPSEAVIGLEITGGLPHNVVFEGFEGDRELVEGEGDGEFAAQVTVPSGTYTYYCSIAGHRAAGMEGEITVE